ncbi:putative sporulation protein YtxC [Desulfotomaculum copahuensis]|uniref:Sporulation protein n=1 Tax=Desulfotomaculum copahuensis TaxID=1838280 RepID=A0A1B7LAX3_9FIRM|nr:putative sporulation protein YtxC [Desulfotomaculum copahuensis]OAT79456.1 hypothetical protein A6M21_01275 [Desulfotomaculum copahuensis]
MAQTISIGAARHQDLIKTRLYREFELLKNMGLQVKLEESPAGNLTFFRVTGREEPCRVDGGDKLKQHIADILSDLILGQWEKFLLRDIIRENYYFFNEDERRDIFNYATQYTGHDGEGRSMVYQLHRRCRVRKKIDEFLGQNNQIVLEGFIRFRLKEYMEELQEAVDRAVDEFLLEREYKEFVQLLKYFVEIQEPRVDMVHVLVSSGGVFQLLDEQKQVINSDYLEGFILDVVKNEISYDDLLISALITLAPGQIVYHTGGGGMQDSTLETIKSVFSGRVCECTGCELCRKKN